jgi:probable F420-dependent oxidoreductase
MRDCLVQLGVAVPISGSWATADNQREAGTRAEQLGYESLWTFQRLLYPAEGDPLAPVYAAVHDPIVTLGFLAGVTARARLGLAVVNMPFYAPVLLAKQLTTVDILSKGRLVAGLGLGWSPLEFAAAGTPYERRGARGEEFLSVLEAIWRDDVVSYDGEFYVVPPSRIDPKPLQRPRPPILLGGMAPAALARAGRMADGWISSSGADLRTIGTAAATVRAAAEEAGRDASAVEIVVRGVVRLRPGGDAERRPLTGDLDEIRGDLVMLADEGVTETFLDLNFDEEVGHPDADAHASMARLHEILEAFAPA